MDRSRAKLEGRIHQVIGAAVRDAIEAFRNEILSEVGRSFGNATASVRGGRAAASGRKRAWPVCSVAGCGKKFFGPSGSARLCYEHYVESGGQHPARRGSGKGGRGGKAARGARGGSSGSALLDQLVTFIAKNPGLRSEQIQKQVRQKPGVVKAALAKLRAARRVKTSGDRRSTTYATT